MSKNYIVYIVGLPSKCKYIN